MTLKTQFFFLSPVEVVEVTKDNLQEAADWCGGRVAQAESRRHPGRMDSYVWVPTPEGTALSWAFPGMYITKRVVINVKDQIRATFAVFRRDYFEANYFDDLLKAMDSTWERQAREAVVKAQAKLANQDLRKVGKRKKQAEYLSKEQLDAARKTIDETPRDFGDSTPDIVTDGQILEFKTASDRPVIEDLGPEALKLKSPAELGQLVDEGKIGINDARMAQGLEPVLEDFPVLREGEVDEMPTVSGVQENANLTIVQAPGGETFIAERNEQGHVVELNPVTLPDHDDRTTFDKLD